MISTENHPILFSNEWCEKVRDLSAFYNKYTRHLENSQTMGIFIIG